MAKKKPKKKRVYRQQPKIRWTKSQIQRLKETVDAYNKNVRRVKRRKDVGAYAPPTEKFNELKKQISSANELNRIVRQLGNFAKIKGKPDMYTNPHGVTMTQWQRNKMKSDIQAENRSRKIKIEKIESGAVYDFDGNVIPNAKREQLKNEFRLIQAKPETIKTIETFVKFEKDIRKLSYLRNPEVQLKRMRDNMIQGIEYVLGKDNGKKYIDKLKSMDAGEIEEFYLKNELSIESFFRYQTESLAEMFGEETYESRFESNLEEMLME